MRLETDTLYWIFSTLPQVLAAWTGLLLAGYTFFIQKLESTDSEDSYYTELSKIIKKQSHKKLSFIIYYAIVVIVIDVICLSIIPIQSYWKMDKPHLYLIFQLFIFILFVNCFAIVYSGNFVSTILNPKFIKRMQDKLLPTLGNNPKNVMEFLEKFFEFEKLLREIYQKKLNYSQKGYYNKGFINLSKILNIISKIEPQDFLPYGNLKEAIIIRNVIVHGGDVKLVNNTIYNSLVNSIQTLKDYLYNN